MLEVKNTIIKEIIGDYIGQFSLSVDGDKFVLKVDNVTCSFPSSVKVDGKDVKVEIQRDFKVVAPQTCKKASCCAKH